MSTNLATTSDDGWGAVPSSSGGLLHGSLLKFAKGAYILNKTEPGPTGIDLLVTGVVTCWVRWEDGKPAEYRIAQPGRRHPDRDELGNLDEDEWPAGLDGEPADPWRDTRYLYLLNVPTAEELTFVTDNYGGRAAIGDLKGAIANMRCAHAGAVPTIRLASEKMKTKVGLLPKPKFTITGWKQSVSGGEIKQIAPREGDDGLGRGHSRDMDDEIPF